MGDAHLGFASPQQPLDLDAYELRLRRWSAMAVGLFAKHFGRQLAASAAGVAPLLERFCDDPGGLDRAFSPAIGEVRFALLTRFADEQQSLGAAAALALALAAEGWPARMRLQFSSAAQLVFDRYALPASRALELDSNGSSARIVAEGHGVLELSRGADGWHAPPSDGVTVLPRIASARPVVVLPRLPALIPLPPGAALGALDGVSASCEAALELVQRFAPSYLPWIARGVANIVPLRTPPGSTSSASFDQLPRVVALTAQAPALDVAELLVHEASHQHVFMLTSVCGPVDDGSDRRLYPSPIKKAERPIDKILLAYHAVANM
ncbi:MAG: hypothetical protein KC503_13965, partial [Myxococcales bacterium]|nr:hypothetical protein [Myxococcales bacterium]